MALPPRTAQERFFRKRGPPNVDVWTAPFSHPSLLKRSKSFQSLKSRSSFESLVDSLRGSPSLPQRSLHRTEYCPGSGSCSWTSDFWKVLRLAIQQLPSPSMCRVPCPARLYTTTYFPTLSSPRLSASFRFFSGASFSTSSELPPYKVVPSSETMICSSRPSRTSRPPLNQPCVQGPSDYSRIEPPHRLSPPPPPFRSAPALQYAHRHLNALGSLSSLATQTTGQSGSFRMLGSESFPPRRDEVLLIGFQALHDFLAPCKCLRISHRHQPDPASIEYALWEHKLPAPWQLQLNKMEACFNPLSMQDV